MSVTTSTYTVRKPNTNVITIAPEIADIDLADTFEILLNSSNTSLSSVFTPNIMPHSELQATMDYRNAFKQGDTITATNTFFNTIASAYFKQIDFSLDAILFWFQRYKYSNKEITSYKSQNSFNNQNLLTNQIPGAALFAQNAVNNANTTSDYFDIVSDSIGLLANSKYIQLDSTLPLFDVDQSFYGVPVPFSASTDSKISAATRNVMYNLSKKTTSLMRRNLLNIGYSNTILQQNMAADATTSHGLNLINDLPTFVNINKALDILKAALGAVYSQIKVFSFVQYLNNIGNVPGYNLRDIFPVSPSDLDFTVITSQESAQASQAIAQQEQADAAANAAIAKQQQDIAINSSSNTFNNPNVASNTASTPTPTGANDVPPDGDKPGYSVVDMKNGQYISKQDLYNLNLYNVQNSGLVGTVPADGATFGITPQQPGESSADFQTRNQQEWATFFTNYAANESGTTGGYTGTGNNGYIKVSESYTESNGQISAGVFSMSVGENGLTSSNINDPAANSAAAIQRSAALIKGDGVIAGNYQSGPPFEGMARYFGPLRRGQGQVG